MFLTYYALFQFHDMMKSYYYSYIFIKCVLTGESFFSIFLLEDNEDDQLHTIIITQYSRLKATPNFFPKFFSIEIPLVF